MYTGFINPDRNNIISMILHMLMKGIILAGGSGTRLYPLTISTSKQLLPVYDKPMIFYPLATLMAAGIREILVISTPADVDKFRHLLKDGSDFGVNISYTVQPSPDGLAQAFILGKEFINGDACAMVLGDNIFYGRKLDRCLRDAAADVERGFSTVFGYKVPDPHRFGVIEFDESGNAISIEEKPQFPRSDYCVTGLYFYTSDVCEKAARIKPSSRGELEITDLNQMYLSEGRLKVQIFGDDFRWWDTGTFDSLMDASLYVQNVNKKNLRTICSPEAIAYRKGWISCEKLSEIAEKYKKTSYGQYLSSLLG